MCHTQNEAPKIAKMAEVTAMDTIDVATIVTMTPLSKELNRSCVND